MSTLANSPSTERSHLATVWSSAKIPAWKSGLLILLGALTVAICFLSRPADTTPVAGVLMDLPKRVSGWWGTASEVSKAELEILPSDTEFARMTYDNGVGDSILCSIVLAGSQDRSIHRPERCLPGQGFTIVRSTPVALEMPDGQNLHVQCLDLSRNQRISEDDSITVRSLYIYWFVGDNFTTNSNFTRMVRSIFDRVFLNRQHRWAYVIVSSTITEGLPRARFPKDRDTTKAMLLDFMKKIVPTFQKDFIEAGGDPTEVAGTN